MGKEFGTLVGDIPQPMLCLLVISLKPFLVFAHHPPCEGMVKVLEYRVKLGLVML